MAISNFYTRALTAFNCALIRIEIENSKQRKKNKKKNLNCFYFAQNLLICVQFLQFTSATKCKHTLAQRTRIQLYAIDIFSGLEMMSIIPYVLFLDGRDDSSTSRVIERKKKKEKKPNMSKCLRDVKKRMCIYNNIHIRAIVVNAVVHSIKQFCTYDVA